MATQWSASGLAPEQLGDRRTLALRRRCRRRRRGRRCSGHRRRSGRLLPFAAGAWRRRRAPQPRRAARLRLGTSARALARALLALPPLLGAPRLALVLLLFLFLVLGTLVDSQ